MRRRIVIGALAAILSFYAALAVLYVAAGPDWGNRAATTLNQWSYDRIRQMEERNPTP